MGSAGWYWNNLLGNWYYDDGIQNNPGIWVLDPNALNFPSGPDWAPEEWLAEHPGWMPVWHPELLIDWGMYYDPTVAGGYVWQPPAPGPDTDAGHWEYSWVDDTPNDDAWPGMPSDGHWEWQWVPNP